MRTELQDLLFEGGKVQSFKEKIPVDLVPVKLIRIDSYSGFPENDKKTQTGLDGYLRSREVRRVFVCGLALDYCVFQTASEAMNISLWTLPKW
ncbi:MAG: isochorismatase family protein [Candidatus Atribacteria bacterium]|nr:MAG: isochorismatase family protein [Candidatus Atribacteria bacterium]